MSESSYFSQFIPRRPKTAADYAADIADASKELLKVAEVLWTAASRVENEQIRGELQSQIKTMLSSIQTVSDSVTEIARRI